MCRRGLRVEEEREVVTMVKGPETKPVLFSAGYLQAPDRMVPFSASIVLWIQGSKLSRSFPCPLASWPLVSSGVSRVGWWGRGWGSLAPSSLEASLPLLTHQLRRCQSPWETPPQSLNSCLIKLTSLRLYDWAICFLPRPKLIRVWF